MLSHCLLQPGEERKAGGGALRRAGGSREALQRCVEPLTPAQAAFGMKPKRFNEIFPLKTQLLAPPKIQHCNFLEISMERTADKEKKKPQNANQA